MVAADWTRCELRDCQRPVLGPALTDEVGAGLALAGTLYAADNEAGAVIAIGGSVPVPGDAPLAFLVVGEEACRRTIFLYRWALAWLDLSDDQGVERLQTHMDPGEPAHLSWVTRLGFRDTGAVVDGLQRWERTRDGG